MIEAGKTAVVLGLGVSGRAAVRYLLARQMKVTVSESRQEKDLTGAERAFLRENGVEAEFGGHTEPFLAKGLFIVVSPGISPDLDVLQKVGAAGVPIVGELALAAGDIDVPVVAITGTNGKTTVTRLIGELLTYCGRKVFIGGNIGTPLLDYLCKPSGADVLVLELSSFQLEMAGVFRADVALLLNVTPDHLDRHGDMENYSAIKMRVYDNQRSGDTAIICADDPVCNQLRHSSNRDDFLLFGHGDHCHAGIHGQCVMVRNNGHDEVYDLSATHLAGHIGVLNSAAAILAAQSMGCEKQQIEKGLAAFALQAHRMEWVAEIHGVVYYNDSKATNTGAVIAALRQLDGPVILIAGGRDKGDDYSLLLADIQANVSRLILIGEAKELIARTLNGAVVIDEADSMEDAVRLAYAEARPGDTVLLSPACASFDMFNNYGQRGDVYKDCVKTLEKEWNSQGVG